MQVITTYMYVHYSARVDELAVLYGTRFLPRKISSLTLSLQTCIYMLYAVLPILCDENLTIETRAYTTRVSKVLYMRPLHSKTYLYHEDMHTAG